MPDRAAIEAKLNRGRITPEARERLEAFNKKQTDWFGRCQRCGKSVEGTIEALLAHGNECDG